MNINIKNKKTAALSLAFTGALFAGILASANAFAQAPKAAAAAAKTAPSKAAPAKPEAPVVGGEGAPAVAASVPLADLQAKMQEARDLNLAGNGVQASAIWKDVYIKADKTPEQQKIAAEAAKMLGFNAVDNRNPKSAEAYFAAEAVISRRLFLTGNMNARNFSASISHWATGAGAMGRSSESAALVYFAREVKARAMAMASQKILNREANFSADAIEGVKVSTDNICAISSIEFLKAQVTCNDEAGALNEAMSLQARQIKADAPPPEVKSDDKDKK